jgi:hypothetical protein
MDRADDLDRAIGRGDRCVDTRDGQGFRLLCFDHVGHAFRLSDLHLSHFIVWTSNVLCYAWIANNITAHVIGRGLSAQIASIPKNMSQIPKFYRSPPRFGGGRRQAFGRWDRDAARTAEIDNP